MAHGMEGDVELPVNSARRVVVADHRHYVHVQRTGVVLHQDVAEAVGLFGDQDDDALLASLDQSALGACRQGVVGSASRVSSIEATFQFGTHEEAAVLVIHELVVLVDVELVLVADVGDLGDEPLASGQSVSSIFFFPSLS